MKIIQPPNQVITESLLGDTWQLTIVIASYEIGLAWWLLSGVARAAARRFAILTFTSFAIVSIGNGLAGENSCGCFGPLHVSPWLTCLIDLSVVALLLKCHSGTRAVGRAVPIATTTLSPSRALVCVCLLIASLTTIHQIGRGRASASAVSSAVEIQLGSLAAGGSTSARFVSENPARDAARIVRVETSCPCLQVNLDAQPLDSARQSESFLSGEVILNLAREPNFLGRLHIRATGLDDQGQPVCSLRVRAEVTASDFQTTSTNHL